MVAGIDADGPVESGMRQPEGVVDAAVGEDLVPAFDTGVTVGDVLAAQIEVERQDRLDLLGTPGAVGPGFFQRGAVVGELVVVLPAVSCQRPLSPDV